MPDVSKNVVVLGAGKVGRLVVHFLASSGDYAVTAVDRSETNVGKAAALGDGVDARVGDITDPAALAALLDGSDYVLSCAPFHCNALIAETARKSGVHYLDLTEDVATTKVVSGLADGADTAFIPQCGLAPGFITIVTKHLADDFDKLDNVKMRVGALPVYPSNRLKYNLTWSTEGLINEYCNPCEAIVDGALIATPPLDGIEPLVVDGVEYEAFNTSGGLGTLAHTWAGRVSSLDYKSIRYPGHRDVIRLLLDDLKFRDDRDTLRAVFERSLPYTHQDVVLIYVTVTGWRNDLYSTISYVKKIYGAEIAGQPWGAIQITTASGLTGVLDLHAHGRLPASGFVKQEQVPFDDFIGNRFGRHYA